MIGRAIWRLIVWCVHEARACHDFRRDPDQRRLVCDCGETMPDLDLSKIRPRTCNPCIEWGAERIPDAETCAALACPMLAFVRPPEFLQ